MAKKLKILVASGIISAAMMSASSAFAAGTTQGELVENQVTVNYSVGGTAQTAVQSNTDSFAVDRVIRFTLVEDTTGARTGRTSVAPNTNNQLTYYRLTNTTNDVMDFNLALAETADTNNILSGLQYFVDANGNGTYEAATDTGTFVNNLAADATVTVFVLGNIVNTAANGQTADAQLTANAHIGSSVVGDTALGTQYTIGGAGAAAVVDNATANTAAVQSIFGDTGRNGTEAATDGYVVSAAALSVVKTSSVLWDPISGSNNPKAIPGSIVQYCIAVTNAAGGAPATGVIISDDFTTAPTTYYATTVASGPATIPAAVANPTSATACNGTGTNADASALTRTGDTVSGNLGNVAAGATEVLLFRVRID